MRPGHAQCAQQVAHEAGLAGAQIAVQFDAGLAQARRAARRRAKAAVSSSVRHSSVRQGREGAFYNHRAWLEMALKSIPLIC
jgi:predicted alpha-1,6-mannanase (GH76 family)